jgi:hypothetical protein
VSTSAAQPLSILLFIVVAVVVVVAAAALRNLAIVAIFRQRTVQKTEKKSTVKL